MKFHINLLDAYYNIICRLCVHRILIVCMAELKKDLNQTLIGGQCIYYCLVLLWGIFVVVNETCYTAAVYLVMFWSCFDLVIPLFELRYCALYHVMICLYYNNLNNNNLHVLYTVMLICSYCTQYMVITLYMHVWSSVCVCHMLSATTMQANNWTDHY